MFALVMLKSSSSLLCSLFGHGVLDRLQHMTDLFEEKDQMPMVFRRAENGVRLEVLLNELLNVARVGETKIRGDQVDLVGDDDHGNVKGMDLVMTGIGDMRGQWIVRGRRGTKTNDFSVDLFDVVEALFSMDVEDQEKEMGTTKAIHANPVLLRIAVVVLVEARRVNDTNVKQTLPVEQRTEVIRGETSRAVRHRRGVVVVKPLSNDRRLSHGSIADHGDLDRLISQRSSRVEKVNCRR